MKKLTLRAVITLPDGSQSLPVTVIGRDAWMLDQLIEVGSRGLTSIERPAPRISHYCWKLRGFGFDISTEYEEHGGPFPGRHGRFRLLSKVRIIADSRKAVAA
ncbi:hypothetical protein KYK30_30200 [Shinella yambaruensis]|uniref:Winged helix domain-containing protein n=1 Tax=Shinella yambaruensis TaxID=415996 RepID=A0ABQ5ZEK5_9HYPH|nr:hypothetical protein [Shinella yambaruensis]MCJ8028743.1 hypothetical protein [Shinella yambaruensis]MCU7983992.1 hypothetical protein [Shinella yambaruensis]GLR49886.1 hypothetical protein GCM10007923_10910 [Shinella yambaruensis]